MSNVMEEWDKILTVDSTYHVPAPLPMSLPYTLIGVMGKARTGKDTVASYLTRNFEFDGMEPWVKRYALADRVKKVASEVFSVEYYDFFDANVKELPQGHLRNESLTPRKLAQLVGTECFRAVFGGQVWIASLHHEIVNSGYVGEAVVVPDIRFPEEVEWVAQQGGILVYLEREDAAEVSAHSSENLMSYSETVLHMTPVQTNWTSVHIENDGTVEQLYNKIEKQVVPLLLK